MAHSQGVVLSNIRDAFDDAVSAFIGWDRDGTEPVMFNNVPIPISTIAGLAEVIKDPMPASVFWRMVSYANRFVDENAATRWIVYLASSTGLGDLDPASNFSDEALARGKGPARRVHPAAGLVGLGRSSQTVDGGSVGR
jgi:hypothetical protein